MRMNSIRFIVLEEVIEFEIGDECDNTIGESCYRESDKGIDHGMSSFFEFFFFTYREDHLDSSPGDREYREDCRESDEPSDDRSDHITSSLIIYHGSELRRRNYIVHTDIRI